MKTLTTENRGLTYDGDTVAMHGRVTKIYPENNETRIDVALQGVKPDGTEVIRGTATVILPPRG